MSVIRSIKTLFLSVLFIVFVIIVATLSLPFIIDPNDYKDEITEQVYKETGRTLTIEGDIALSFSLPLSVSLQLGKMQLSNAKGFSGEYFARLQDAFLYVAIMPLLMDNRLDIGEIKLLGVELNLHKNKQGETNWSDLAGEKKVLAKVTKKPAEISDQSSSDKHSMPLMSLAGVKINDAIINWTDEQAGQHVRLSKTNITLSKLVEDKPFSVSLITHINSSQPAIMGDISLKSSPTISLSQQLFQLPDSELSLSLTGDVLPGGINKSHLSGDIRFNAKTQELDINNMQLTSGNTVIKGLLHGQQLNSQAQFSGKIKVEKFSPKQLAKDLHIVLPKMKDEKVLNSALAEFTFKADSNKVTIHSLEASLDDIMLKGTVSINDFKKPFYTFDLALNQLNLDNYALAEQTQAVVDASPAVKKSAAKKESKPPTSANKKEQQAAPIFPIEILRQLNLSGQLAITEFIAAKMKMSNVVIVLKGKNGQLKLAPLKAELYKGTLNLKTDIDVRGKTPKLKITKEFKNVQLGDLLLATTGSEEFTGSAHISSQINTHGNDKDRLLKNSNGSAKFLVTDGHIKQLDILTTLRQAQAFYRGKKAPTEQQDKATKFTELKGSVIIKNGVLHNKDLSSRSPIMQVTGKGYVDLPKEYIDYELQVKLLDSLKIDKQTRGSDLSSKSIPYTIQGKFSDIKQHADITKTIEKEVKKKIIEKLEEKIDKKYVDELKRFFQ